MKRMPQAHQSIAPDLGVTIVLIGIVVLMGIVLVVVSIAD
jgi:uncharacterized membrane protein YkgB